MHFHERHSLAVLPHGTLERVDGGSVPEVAPEATGIRGRGRFRRIEIPTRRQRAFAGLQSASCLSWSVSRPFATVKGIVHRLRAIVRPFFAAAAQFD
jgi:hypothetical protein